MFRTQTIASVLSALALALVPVANATEVALYDDVADGYATFHVDEFGAIKGCAGGGIVFDPTGASGATQTDCNTLLYMFDVANQVRQPVADNFWLRMNQCPGVYSGEAIPSTANDVYADAVNGTQVRTSRFVLPEFPDLDIALRQTVCGSKLTQTYTIENTSMTDVDLRLTRGADFDIPYYVHNWGSEYPYGDPNPYGASILGPNFSTSMTLTAPPDAGDAVFEGWRAARGITGGRNVHPEILSNYGYDSALTYPGAGGDGLNGIWLGNYANWCNVDAGDTPYAPDFDAYQAAGHPRGDFSASVQSSLHIPAGDAKVYVTETIGDPGIACSLDDTIALECDCDTATNNGAYQSCVTALVNAAWQRGEIAANQKNSYIQAAAHTVCPPPTQP